MAPFMEQTPPITDRLNAWAARDAGQEGAGDGEVFELVYERLHEIAAAHFRKRGDRRYLQTTSVLNEAYLRLAGASGLRFNDRSHFFAYCSRVMRHVLLDFAKQQGRIKRGAGAVHVSLEQSLVDSESHRVRRSRGRP